MPTRQTTWSTPKMIAENKKLWSKYIAGFFDAEGYCPSVKTVEKTGRYKLKITQTNKESLEFIRKALSTFPINSAGPYKNRSTYDLYINGLENVKRFYTHIPVIRKKNELNSLLSPRKRVPSEASIRMTSMEMEQGVEH